MLIAERNSKKVKKKNYQQWIFLHVYRKEGKNWVDGGQEQERIRLFILNISKNLKYTYFLTVQIYYSPKTLKVKVAQSCLTICNPMDYTVHWIIEARILEWVAFPFSRGSSQPRESNPGLPHCRQILYQLSYQGSPDGSKTLQILIVVVV